MNIARGMLLLGYITIAPAILTGCSGGGGGDDGPSDEEACQQYCGFACAKGANCGFYPASDIGICTSTCFDSTQDINRDAESCQNAQFAVQDQTCSELATTLGLSGRILSKSDSEEYKYLAESFGQAASEKLF